MEERKRYNIKTKENPIYIWFTEKEACEFELFNGIKPELV